MKFFTFKRIIALILVLAIGVTLGIYFLGGMDPYKLNIDNIEFDESAFKDFTSSGGVKETDFKYYRTTEDGGKEEVTFEKKVKISENDKYVMYLDEETTVFTVFEKATNKLVYQSARTGTDEQPVEDASGANLIVNYLQKENGKTAANGLDTLNYSVQFKNELTGEKEKHYKINYLKDANGNYIGAQILYTVGMFSANANYFPSIFEKMVYGTEDEITQARNLYSLEYLLRGNTIFDINDEMKTDPVIGTYYLRTYTGTGTTYSREVAEYIEQHGLGFAEERNGYWTLTDLTPELLYGYGTHINVKGSPIEVNPFISKKIFTKIISYYGSAGVPLSGDSANGGNRYVYKLQSTSHQVLSHLYTYLYASTVEVDVLKELYPIYQEDKNGELKPVISGGYQARDEDGDFLYDENGEPVQELFTLAKVKQINAHFGIESFASLQRFQVGLQITLNDQGVVASIMGNTLRDSQHAKLDPQFNHDFYMYSIDILPELTTIRDVNAEGYMIIPDGSGALINLNNEKAKLNYSPYTSSVYGRDYGFALTRQPEQTQTLMFGMYGLVNTTDRKGLMVVAEKGASQSILKADTPRGANKSNYIYYTTVIRQNEVVKAGTGWNTSTFNKWAPKLYANDLEYRYVFLENDELSYVGVAKKYRDYLINKYNLEVKDTTTSNLVDVNFLGAYEKYALFLGVKYMTDDSLTKFSEARKIVDELLGRNVDTLSVGYVSWTSKELEYETTAKLKVSKVLGGKKEMNKLSQYLSEKSIAFYPELNITSSKGYDYTFGEMKYTAKSVGNFYAKQYPFNLATLDINKKLNPTYYLNPAYYQPVTQNVMKSYSKLGIEGVYLNDLGNYRLGSYNRNNEIYPELGRYYQEEAFAYVQDKVGNIKVSAPFDYAFPYVKLAVDVPLVSSTYGIFDATIPFYQLVVTGLFDYTTDTVNGTSDKSADWYFAKALETGSNLQFLLSYTDPEVLLETDYTQYYKSYYNNWKDKIVEMNNKINEAGIHGGQLTNHVIIDKDVSMVTYSKGLTTVVTLVVNTGSKVYNYNGTQIPAYSYIKL